MKKTLFKKCIACLLLILVIAAGFAIPSSAYSSQSSKLFSLLASEGGSLQGYIDNILSAEAGRGDSEWFFIALKGHNPSLNGDKYVAALDSYVSQNTITKETDFERIAMAYTAAGVNNDFVKSALNLDLSSSTINGVFFELILIDSGNYESARNSRSDLINKILNGQKSDGGWTISVPPSDVDMTAMALQALAPYASRSDVAAAIESALSFLSKKQTPEGDFLGFRNAVSSESTSQVIIALTALGIDPGKDNRFIKTDSQDSSIQHTAYDGLRRYQLSDGSYCHMIGKAKDYKATSQAACALAAAERFNAGKPALYSFGKPHEPSIDNPAESSDKPDETASSPAPGTETNSSSEDSVSSSSSSDDSSDSSDESEESSEYSFNKSSSEYGSEARDDEPSVIASTGKTTYKFYVCAGIAIIFAGVCGYLAAKKIATLKNIIPITIVAALLICGVIFINFTSVKDYYSVNLASASDGDESVTISISCRVLDGVADDYPEDGYILKPTQYVINDGDTVFDALLAVTRANHIKINYTGSSGGLLTVYVSSIAGYSEMQFGALSGWIYRVNKYTPDVGCGSYEIKDGDVIEWVYTLDLGKDVEN